MTHLKEYILDPNVTPKTKPCRIRAWAHDHAISFMWMLVVSQAGWIVTVLTCH